MSTQNKEQKKELCEKLMRLQRLSHRFRVHTKIAQGPLDASGGQGRVLAILKIRPEIGVGELSYLLGIRPSSLNELLNKLEKSGYITREASQEDKRAVIVRLTEKGKNEELPDTGVESIFDCLNENEQKNFGEYLDRILVSLENAVGGERDSFDLLNALRGRYGDDFGRKFERFSDDLDRKAEHFFDDMRRGFRRGFGPRDPRDGDDGGDFKDDGKNDE